MVSVTGPCAICLELRLARSLRDSFAACARHYVCGKGASTGFARIVTEIGAFLYIYCAYCSGVLGRAIDLSVGVDQLDQMPADHIAAHRIDVTNTFREANQLCAMKGNEGA